MEFLKQLEVWFVVGSQHLYGAETLKQVADHAQTITNQLNEKAGLPLKIVLKPNQVRLVLIAPWPNWHIKNAGQVLWQYLAIDSL